MNRPSTAICPKPWHPDFATQAHRHPEKYPFRTPEAALRYSEKSNRQIDVESLVPPDDVAYVIVLAGGEVSS